jgi:hypothetical protein
MASDGACGLSVLRGEPDFLFGSNTCQPALVFGRIGATGMPCPGHLEPSSSLHDDRCSVLTKATIGTSACHLLTDMSSSPIEVVSKWPEKTTCKSR